MNGALVGFRIGGENKLLRLHGERSCEAVLNKLLTYLRSVGDAQLKAYARQIRPIGPADGPFLSDIERQSLAAFDHKTCGESLAPTSWAEVFMRWPDVQVWHAGLPYMPAALLERCGDILWGFLLDLDAGDLQVFDNRQARFFWSDLGATEAPNCTVSLQHARMLTAPDVHALHVVLQQQVCCDGLEPLVPVRDGVSDPFAGPGAWSARLHCRGGQVRLQLEREAMKLQFSRVGELSLGDTACGPFLCEALDPHVLALSQSVYGSDARLTQVAQLAANVQLLPFAPADAGLPLLDLGLRTSNGLELSLGPDFFLAVRALFMSAGMTVQGWRYLIKQEQAALRSVLKFFPPSKRIMGSFTHFINLLASALQSELLKPARCQAALGGVERILDRTRGRPDPVREANARIFLRAIMRARLAADELANLEHEAQDISDFVYSHSSVLKGVTWASLRRRAHAWHKALLITVDPATDVHWLALLPQHQVGAFVAVELDSGYLLAEEGLEQRHCIGTYVNACSSGASRVFSLRLSGRRMATIELQRSHGDAWRMVQIRGKANSVVNDAATVQAGEALALAYSTKALAHERAQTGLTQLALRAGNYQSPAYLVHRQDHWTG